MSQRVVGESMEQSIVCKVYVFNLVGWSQLSDFRGPVVSATNPNRKGPSSNPRKAEHSHDSSYDIVDFL